jgi:hypothetical protein
MTMVLWMAAGCLVSALVVVAINASLISEVFLGMLGPLAALAGTWLVLDRASRLNPSKVTSVMLVGFVVKAIFFALYVVVAMRLPGLDRQPFVVSFVCYLVALYAIEAVALRRLFERAPLAGR